VSIDRLIVRGATVFDGSGEDPFSADVLVEADRIAAIGRFTDVDADELDAGGCYLTPGFIDIHSHSDYTLLVDPRAQSSIYQGVTTEVVGNCGYGCFPIARPELARNSIYGFTEDLPLTWRTAPEYFERLAQAAPAVNVLAMVPNAQLRMSVMERPGVRASSREIADMLRLLEEAMEAGAWGYSTGLEYAIEERATVEEVAELCRAVRRYGGIYATHTRERNGDGVAGIAEAIETARRADIQLQLSHLLPRGGLEAGRRAIEVVDAARDHGDNVAFDQHTRPHGFTFLHVALPPAALDGGPAALKKRLEDAEQRRAMSSYRGLLPDDFSRIVLLDNPRWPEYARMDIQSIADQRTQDPHEAIFDLLYGAIEQLHQMMVIIPSYSHEQHCEVFAHPLCMPASDATALSPDGPLADNTFHGAYTWAAWYWRSMVRQERVLSEAEAVRRLTCRPAQTMKLGDRGRVQVGAKADLAIFDPDRFAERGTTFDPNCLADGVTHVIVNGVVTLRDGEMTGHRAGRVLRRSAHG
jgi:N-acyl-D-aspartate/D-glutamate deacylase